MSDEFIRSDFEPLLTGSAEAWGRGETGPLGAFADWCSDNYHPWEEPLRAIHTLGRFPFAIDLHRRRAGPRVVWGIHDGGGTASVTVAQWREWGSPGGYTNPRDNEVECRVPAAHSLPIFWFLAAYDDEYHRHGGEHWWMAVDPAGILRIAVEAYLALPALQRAMYQAGHDENRMRGGEQYLALAGGMDTQQCPACCAHRPPRIRFVASPVARRCRLCHNLGLVLARPCGGCGGARCSECSTRGWVVA